MIFGVLVNGMSILFVSKPAIILVYVFLIIVQCSLCVKDKVYMCFLSSAFRVDPLHDKILTLTILITKDLYSRFE
jgi:hypothetical protein